jgi:hypothetical protein
MSGGILSEKLNKNPTKQLAHIFRILNGKRPESIINEGGRSGIRGIISFSLPSL